MESINNLIAIRLSFALLILYISLVFL